VKAPTSNPNPLLAGLRLPAGIPTPNPCYRSMRMLLRGTVTAWLKVRVFDRRFEPAAGSAVYICNHQSFMDPILMSYALRRPMNYMARDTLFHNPVFRRMIESVNAFPVRRGRTDLTAMKEAMRRLKAGHQVVLFAEGTRTLDGRIGHFLPGVALLAQRTADWTVPVVIDGAFEAWPRTQLLPGPGNVVVRYAPPIPQAETRKMSAADLVAMLRRTIIDLQADTRRRVGRPALKYE
jgi:1-acyl-sn-glycerol-3-phosphate acyltransferase